MTGDQHTAAIVVGIDTHADFHVAVALSGHGQRLGELTFAATTGGCHRLIRWVGDFGAVHAFGIEGTGSYGAGVARQLTASGYTVLEVQRPNRQVRRLRGKSDPVDAEAAARAVLAGEVHSHPKSGDSVVEMIRLLRIARHSAMTSRVQASNQMTAVVVTAPAALRERLHGLSSRQLVEVAARFRVGRLESPEDATKYALRSLAQRWLALADETATLDTALDRLTMTRAPRLRALLGVGADVAGALLVAAGDNPERLHSEASFAQLCGVAPLPASSGKTQHRHRLNRGGNRQANSALWRIAITRMSCHQPTQRYCARRTAQGLSKREIIRCLKRYVAREVYPLLA